MGQNNNNRQNHNNNQNASNRVQGRELTVIGPDTRIKGEMHFDSGARILGRFEGRIASGGEVQIGSGAVCDATVEAETVVVDGTVSGDIQASSQLSLNANAVINGDIAAGTLVVTEGATFVGHCRVGPQADGLDMPSAAAARTAQASAGVVSQPAQAPVAPVVQETAPAMIPEPKPTTAGAPEAVTVDLTPPWKAEVEATDAVRPKAKKLSDEASVA